MKAWMVLLVIGGALFTSCDKNDDGDKNPYPVWNLYVTVQDGRTFQPVTTCARVVWNFSGSAESITNSCNDLDPGNPGRVKVWRSFGDSETVTISYRAECDGYLPSTEMSQFFDRALAETLPGHPGDEVNVYATVRIYAQ